MIQSDATRDIEHIIEDYPSPSNPEEIGFRIESVKGALSSPTQGFPRAKALLKLADLLVGRNRPGDYLEAEKVYDEALSTTLPGDEENSKALIGKAELALPLSSNPSEIKSAVESCKKALKSLKGKPSDFFFAKGMAVEAELLLKLGGKEEREEAIGLYEEIISKPTTDMYFKLRAVVGVIDLLEAFYKEDLRAKHDRYISALQEAVAAFGEGRPNDYFRIKGMILLSEMMLIKDRAALGENAKRLLLEVINNESASDDLRARASLTLAEVSTSSLARSLIKGVRKMDGIDPYLLRRATTLEDALRGQNPPQ